MKTDKGPTRSGDILLGPLERPALEWLAVRMPRWITPDFLTAIGFSGAILTGLSYWLTLYSPGFLWLASLGLMVNWFGDSLDGTLARFRKIERPRYGFFLDHSLDVLSGFLIALGIGLSPYVRFGYAMVGLSGYLLMSISAYVRTNVTGVLQMSYFKIGTTEIRVIIMLANTVVFFVGNPRINTFIGRTTIYDLFALAFGTILIIVFIVVTFTVARQLGKREQSAPR